MDFLPAMDGPVPWMIGCAVGACTTAALLAYNYNRFFVQPPISKAQTAIAKAAPGDRDALFVLYQGLSRVKGPSGSLSQFCLKVEAFLRVAKIPYKSKNASPLNAPKGKIPFGVHGSSTLCDSKDMIRYLLNTFSDEAGGRKNSVSNREGDAKGRLGSLVLPGSMSPVQAATASAVEALLDHRIYYSVMHNRWGVDKHFAILYDLFFATVPFPLRGLISGMVRRGVAETVRAQGLWAHSAEDQARRAREDWETVAALIPGTDAEPGYLGGAGPCAEDCTLFAALDNVLNSPFASSFKTFLIERQPKLVTYCDRFRADFFPDVGPVVPEVREDDKLILTKSS